MTNFRFLLLSLVFALSPGGVIAADDVVLATQAMQVVEQRCMVCHGCYDAPCQLKLEARAGLERGASKALVYDAARLREADMTRLFIDAQTPREWREKGFYPVLDEADPSRGLVYRMLELKRAHPLPASAPLPEGFDFSLDRAQQCPQPGEFDQFAADYPFWGMPYGLPGLGEEDDATLRAWLERGAPAPPLPPLGEGVEAALAQWEAFLNAADNKPRLMARYLYEHLFLADIYFGGTGVPVWFRLVRSTTPPGQPIAVIPSRRPFDDPGRKQFWYRFLRLPLTPLAKIHMPYRLDAARMARYRELFLAPDYQVAELPGYKRELSANPFRSFQAIPARSRYRFLLDEARFTIMNFIKGPVCRGRVALNVIDDRFWVMFANPEDIDADRDEVFLAKNADNMRVPTVRTGTAIDILAWRKYSKREQKYGKARARYMLERLERKDLDFGADAIWDGDGNNPNAALTVFRHFDTASVEQGFIGAVPKTAWVVGYPLLERIHYLLVANYDVYGAVSHQLESRLYMDFLRMEGESNFLIFMPEEARHTLWEHWYRDAPASATEYLEERLGNAAEVVQFDYTSDDPKTEFLLDIKKRLYGAQGSAWDYHGRAAPEVAAAFDRLQAAVGEHNSFLPQVTFLNIVGESSDEVYTLLRDSGYSNIAQLFAEAERRLPVEDALTIVPGFLGAYPNSFLMVNEREILRFAEAVAGLKSTADYERLLDRWGVGRSDPWFWKVSDKFHAMLARQQPLEGGILDYSRYHAGNYPAHEAH